MKNIRDYGECATLIEASILDFYDGDDDLIEALHREAHRLYDCFTDPDDV